MSTRGCLGSQVRSSSRRGEENQFPKQTPNICPSTASVRQRGLTRGGRPYMSEKLGVPQRLAMWSLAESRSVRRQWIRAKTKQQREDGVLFFPGCKGQRRQPDLQNPISPRMPAEQFGYDLRPSPVNCFGKCAAVDTHAIRVRARISTACQENADCARVPFLSGPNKRQVRRNTGRVDIGTRGDQKLAQSPRLFSNSKAQHLSGWRRALRKKACCSSNIAPLNRSQQFILQLSSLRHGPLICWVCTQNQLPADSTTQLRWTSVPHSGA